MKPLPDRTSEGPANPGGNSDPETAGRGRRAMIRGLGLLAGGFAAGRTGFAGAVRNEVPIIDAQSHILYLVRRELVRRESPLDVAPRALRLMDGANVQAAVLVPRPITAAKSVYGLKELEAVQRRYPTRFAFVAGGDSLNPTIQGTPAEGATPDAIRRFVAVAEEIAAAGAAGFGELAVEHFSFVRGRHAYESSPADHPMLLALADVAARHDMPVGLHMEAVPHAMPFPAARPSGPSPGGENPGMLKENISGLERLLDHNPSARIVWLHAGWDLTGERTVALMRGLLGRHPNLFMTVKSDHCGIHKTSPFLPGFRIKPGWLNMLSAFPDRFAVGSDQFFEQAPEGIERARKLIDALPPDLARLVGRENVRRIYRLPAWA